MPPGQRSPPPAEAVLAQDMAKEGSVHALASSGGLAAEGAVGSGSSSA